MSDEPVFLRGYFGARTFKSSDLTFDQRVQYRKIYRKLYQSSDKSYAGKMKARRLLRTMLSAEV